MNAVAELNDAGESRIHQPAMAAEVCALLAARNPQTIVDATVGTGGHAELLLLSGAARLIGLDRDAGALEVARERLGKFGARATLCRADFAELDAVLDENRIESVDAIIADLGMSSFALDDPARGFSFRAEGPLDMRMDRAQALSAFNLVNEENEAELARIIREYGEEPAARRVARAIVNARRRRSIETTVELRAIVERALTSRHRGGLHPATRTFQAIRIAVNRELETLVALLERAPMRLAAGGRMAVIAYHSLEDRAVKDCFRELTLSGEFVAVTRKAMRPSQSEIAGNPRARSARLRCIERGTR